MILADVLTGCTGLGGYDNKPQLAGKIKLSANVNRLALDIKGF